LSLAPPKIDTKIVDPLTDAELKDLIKVCQGRTFRDRRDEALIRLLAETGMRSGECCSLTLDDVDIPHGKANVIRSKTGSGRVVPFGAITAQSLDRYLRMRRSHRLADTQEFWLGDRSRSFGGNALYRAVIYRAGLAGIENMHPHRLRHTAASRWLAAGGSEGGLMSVAGWSNRQMLDRYTAASASSRAADEARKLGLGDI
jgi:integrase/recombinase XerD